MNMKKKKIVIYGIGSLQNRGCEALVNSSIYQFPKEDEIIAATFDYEHDKDTYKGRIKKMVDHHKHDETKFNNEEKEEFKKLQSRPWNTRDYECFYERDVINEMKDADLCIHIGGDNYCYGVNEWIYAVTSTSRELGKKTVLWGASLYDDITDLSLINDLKNYDLLMLREKISYNAIKPYISEDRLMLTPDPAFSMEPKEVKINKWYNQKKKILGINLSPLTIKTEESEKAIEAFVKYILKETDYNIALIPHVSVDEVNDLVVLKKLKEKFPTEDRIYLEEENYNCQEIKYVIGKCDFFVAARTHASIAAYSQEIPTLVIGYSVKSRGIAEDLFGNYKDYVIPMDELKGNALIDKFKKIYDNKEQVHKTLVEKMKTIRKDAKSMYQKMMERLELLDQKYVCREEKCTGCMACYNACPVNAIELVENSEGFTYPKINLEKCIHCNKCRKVCQARNSELINKKKEDIICYGAKNKDEEICKQSTSGGVFTSLATEVLKNKGIVYGAEMENYKVSHVRITKKNEIGRIRGSKYSQSHMNDIYKQVKKDLDSKKEVLFSGTPCQILGLSKYLDKKYNNLTLVSVICHGVLNEKLLQKRIKEYEEKYDTKMNKVYFRSKVNGWDPSRIEYQSDRIDKALTFQEDPMMELYVNNFILRDSCYSCPAKGIEKNPADIILGDFWGIYHINQEFYDKKGVSSVILKTKKGKELFDKVKENFDLMDTTLDVIKTYNPSLVVSPSRDHYRNKIFHDLEKSNFDVIAENGRYRSETSDGKTVAILREELQSIYSSKRYQIANKVGNILGKLRFRR